MGRKKVPRRIIEPDGRYNSVLVSKLINYVMQGGNKSIARKVVYDCFEVIAENTKKDPVEVFDEAMRNVSPNTEVRSRRVGGATYQVPYEVRGERRISLALRWMLAVAQAKKGKAMYLRLADVLVESSENTGEAVKKRENTHRMADANKAFAHFAW